jgi:hypothetical protein
VQAIVDDRALVVHLGLLLCVQALQLGQARGAVRDRARAAQPIDRPPPRGGGDPRARVVRDASRRQTVTAASKASCTASSASWKSPASSS